MRNLSIWSIFIFFAACGDGAVGENGDSPDAGALPDAGTHITRDADAGLETADAGPPGPEPKSEPPVMCGATFPGPVIPNIVDFAPGYEEELRALDITAYPPPYDLTAEAPFFKGVVKYMLGREGDIVTEDDLAGAGKLGRAIRGAFAVGQGELDFTFLRRGFQQYYLCSTPIPPDLDTLKDWYGDYDTWTQKQIPCGAPKDGPRYLYGTEGGRISIAETIVDGNVRETEVIFRDLRDDGNLDFAAYTADGELMNRSEFYTPGGTVTLASPYACMSCHVEASTGRFNVMHPTGTGAGCN